MAEILVKEYRGDVVENVHYGSIAIVSSTGETIAYTGDIERRNLYAFRKQTDSGASYPARRSS